jgi:flagellin
MSLRVNTNVESLDAHRNLQQTSTALSSSMQKLSSGLRINSAADDAAGLAISESMRGQIRGLVQAQSNALDGVSLIQTADGAMNEMHAILQRVRELAVERANGTLTTTDQANLDLEVAQLTAELGRINSSTTFNKLDVLSNSTITFQVGANGGEIISVSLTSLAFVGLDASNITAIDTAINSVSTSRANLGAIQNRLQDAITNAATYQENLSAAESRIRDVDVAAEMTNLTKLQILEQSGIAMLAQANQAPQQLLQLLH